MARWLDEQGDAWIAALLRDAGWQVNDKRIERLWRHEGLKVPMKQPKKGRLRLNDGSCIRLRPELDHLVLEATSVAAAHAFIAICPHLSGGAHGSPSDILVEDIVEEPVPAGATYIKISDRPGLGIELNETVVDRYRASG